MIDPTSHFVRPRPYSSSRFRAIHEVNTLDEALAFAQVFAQEIRRDPKMRRIYQGFLGLTNDQFEALLAFSVWKLRGLTTALR